MNGIRRKDGRKPVAIRPDVVPLDYYDEISDEAFANLKALVKEQNDPAHKRVLVDGIDWPDEAV